MSTNFIKKAINLLGSQTLLAKEVGVSQPAIHKWLHGSNLVSPRFVLLIEQATEGKVTRYELRPDIYPVEQNYNKALNNENQANT